MTQGIDLQYCKVNAVSEQTSFLLPRLDDVWDAIGEAKASHFTALDLASGFGQLPLHPETKHELLITQQGQYQWNSYRSILKQNTRAPYHAARSVPVEQLPLHPETKHKSSLSRSKVSTSGTVTAPS